MKWRRLGKWAKWICTLAAGATVALTAFSRFYYCSYARISPTQPRFVKIAVTGGLVRFTDYHGTVMPTVMSQGVWEVSPVSRWYWGVSSEIGQFGVIQPWSAGLLFGGDSTGWVVGMSLVYPILFTTVPGAVLWYADRRRRGPGLCGLCGYDRAGLGADTKCPECGRVPS